MNEQLALRGLIIGCAGCVVITASSAYVALKMSALPWPIIFAAVVSLFFLKTVSKGSSTLNEANVTHAVMSAGAFVVGLILGFVLHIAKPPSMMVGLGIYLPFYMSLTAFLGAMCKLSYDAIAKSRALGAGLSEDDLKEKLAESDESGFVVASGLLGGESIVGILLALAASAAAFLA